MTSYYNTATMDKLLTRDWFVEDDDIEDVLDAADSDAWDWVYENRAKYSTRIRSRIEPDDYRVPLEEFDVKVVELSDKAFAQIKSDRKKALEEQFERDWAKHADSLPDRPYQAVDTELDDLWNKFSHAKAELTKYLEKPSSKKYTSPGSRENLVSAKQAEIEEKIRIAENEYLAAQVSVDAEDELYWNKQRDEYAKIWLPSM
jgi:hypothetical protein